MEKYGGAHDATMQAEHAGRPLAHEREGLPTYLQSFTPSPGGLFSRAAPVNQLYVGIGDPHRSIDVPPVFCYKNLKPSSKKAEMGAFLLINLYVDDHELFEMNKNLQYKRKSSSAGLSSVNSTMVELYKITYPELCKEICTRIVFFENPLHCFNNG